MESPTIYRVAYLKFVELLLDNVFFHTLFFFNQCVQITLTKETTSTELVRHKLASVSHPP
jgi:hypothetical protein